MLTAVLAAGMLLSTACGQSDGESGRAGRFFLVDQRTQVPVVSCAVPPNWMAGGKTTWTTRRELPVHWYVWSLSPDQRTKIIFSSQQLLPAVGRLRQVPFLRDPAILADMLATGARRDYNLSGIRLIEARFNPQQPDRNLLETRIRQARERGIQPTDMLFTELVIRFEGYRGEEKTALFFSLPILAMENRPTAMSYNTIAEVLMPMSFCCPVGAEEATRQVLQQIVGSIRMNPGFIALINRITARRVAEWIRIQNEIHDQQMEVASSASRTQDKVRNMWSEYIRDVDTVTNPGTGEKMLVDSRYDHAWINSEGEVIYHNSGFNTPNASTATFDPNSNALFNRTNWQKLK
jgi:hypothetical protein